MKPDVIFMTITLIITLLNCILIFISTRSTKVIRKYLNGFVFVKIWLDEEITYGWVKRSEFFRFVNHNLSEYDSINLEMNDRIEVIRVGTIKRFKEIKSLFMMELRNL